MGAVVDDGVSDITSIWKYIPDGYIDAITVANTSPDVTDKAGEGTLSGDYSGITQVSSVWSWTGLDQSYADFAPSTATNEELDATKDLRFNGAGGLVVLNAPINMGAGKLQFSSYYTVKSADGLNATWTGGGIEVDADKSVLWQVNGVASDALHKIGAGTLHVNAEGNNEGSLNVGDGTVILDQRADADGNKQAFSSVTLVSGRPTVVLSDADQVASSDSLNITGYTREDVSFNTFSGSNPNGTPGSIYVYKNPYTKDTEYFQLNTSSYWYFPTDKSSTSTWTYLGTDADAAVDYRLTQLNRLGVSRLSGRNG